MFGLIRWDISGEFILYLYEKKQYRECPKHYRQVFTKAYEDEVHQMSPGDSNTQSAPTFPILRGESVGESGEFSGRVVLICEKKDLEREWASDEIAVLHHDMEQHFIDNPGDLDILMSNVSAVISEFGDSVSEFAAAAYHRMNIAIVKVKDACHVLENNMHVRVFAYENQGDVFFID